MPVIINGSEILDAEIETEIAYHQQASHPVEEALRALVIRRVVLDEALSQGLDISDPDSAAEQLLEKNISAPVATTEDCHRHYLQHPEHFSVGELVEASHILFQVTPNVDLDALRAQAQTIMDQALSAPERFEELAIAFSNCPSAALGGSLGQLSRGETVPEFDRVIFSAQPGAILPALLETRFGLHILKVNRKVTGKLMPFKDVEKQIAQALHASSLDRATQQYLKLLVGRAKLEGIHFDAVDGMLVQ